MTLHLHRRALLIGTEHHDDARLDALPCTRADTAQLDEVLSHPAIGGFETVDIAHNLSAAGLRSATAEFLDGCEEDELALLYLSGHGARLVESGGEFFFIATDSDIDDLSGTGVSASFVNERLESCLARQKVAVLDCCHSGGFALGFRTVDGPAKSMASAHSGVPLAARGAYVLSSSAVEEASFGGGGSADAPEPSVFTAAVVRTLWTGAAGGSVGGDVTVDELFDAVSERLRGSGQRPVKSALHVDGRIRIASRPRGPVPPAATRSPRPQRRVAPPPADPDWPVLLGYFREAVQAGMAAFELMPVSGGPFACLPGPERLLTADLDAGGCIPVPTDAASRLVTTAVEEKLELWAGWPAVILTEQRRRRFAPLLIRRVDVVTDDSGIARLQPDGTVLPHPGLARALLDEDGAAVLLSNYQPSWRAGERERLGSDAAHLLQELDIPLVEELRPAALSEQLDGAGPGDGAVNVAVLFATETTPYDKSLLADLDEIRSMPGCIPRTALAALFDQGELAQKDPLVVVSPLPANAGQRAVLQSAMTRRLTVATGPPGTGKSQLIVDVVATAVAAGQSVLVASTNNGAVDEVWRRCDKLVPGSVVRTGSGENRTRELEGLQKLLGLPAPEPNLVTLRAAHRSAAERLDSCRTTFQQVAERELCLIEARVQLCAAAARLGVNSAWRPATDVGRAHSLARAPTWLFGRWRRGRLLRRAGVPGRHSDTAETCRALGDFADAVARWEQLCSAAARTPSDDVLSAELDAAQIAVSAASRDLLRAAIHTAARDGQDKIRELVTARQSGTDWKQVANVLAHVRSWAVTCQSARRFPPRPALFDLVVIDEASQCPIPHVVPLLFRAERALIVGDVMQLPHISGLSPRQDRELRNRHTIGSAWADEHCQSVRRHSAFHAAQRAASGRLLLDEHYRSHPEIAALANRLFYGGALTVLTEIRGRPALTGRSIRWHDVTGQAIRGPNGGSWRNPDETAQTVECVKHLLAQLPPEATIGVVTPYAAQSTDVRRQLGIGTGKHGDRVRVGTVHTFQGGERDVMVLTLVAGQNVPPRCFDWIDRQPQLWNVAITRAHSNLIVVGDRRLWRRRGGVGAELAVASETAPDEHRHDEALRTRLYNHLHHDDPAVQLGVVVNGHPADAQLSDGSAVLLDPGTANGRDPAVHLEQMLRRRRLLAGPDTRAARRIPAWTLDEDGI